jgi:hypothetical protein
VLTILEAGFDDATAVLALPEPYRRRLRTSNGMERHEQWTTGRRYFDMLLYWQWRRDQQVAASAAVPGLAAPNAWLTLNTGRSASHAI